MASYPAPPGLSKRSAQWKRERVIAAGMKFFGYPYQHHHIPEWEPPRAANKGTKGVDCSNFAAFIYNFALGIQIPSGIGKLGGITQASGPGSGHTTPVERIELPKDLASYAKVLRTGDLLIMKSNTGYAKHVVLWVGDMGKSPDKHNLILDSSGNIAGDANGQAVPNGIYLRAIWQGNWYFGQASRALRVIADDSPARVGK